MSSNNKFCMINFLTFTTIILKSRRFCDFWWIHCVKVQRNQLEAIYLRDLTTKLSILIVIVNCDKCWWCRWQEKVDITALMFGVVGNICLVFMFFPVARGSSLLPLLGLTSESCIKYHIWLGHIALVLFTAHGLSYITLWAIMHQISSVS